jgi:hypothetical protein
VPVRYDRAPSLGTWPGGDLPDMIDARTRGEEGLTRRPPTAASRGKGVGDADFVVWSGPTTAGVPEGGSFLADAQRLLDAAANFRQDAVQGLNPGQLAYEFRDVDACWQRLARRTNRIARGRTGPNIGQVARIGETCEQLHRALGMPGYPAAFGVPR